MGPPPQRRRERRLRGAWRHEQLSVKVALAAAQHHSAPKRAVPRTHEALRVQTTATAAGKRPAPLAEVSGPQEAAVTVGHVAAAGAPSPATPSLADAGGDAVDAVTAEFLVGAARARGTGAMWARITSLFVVWWYAVTAMWARFVSCST